ncbi:MAG: hypothetical protein R3352_01075 [Salinisphaeraceae bacterium]|nr:hypothetical protein [Salinisphaeraceae bacterium]
MEEEGLGIIRRSRILGARGAVERAFALIEDNVERMAPEIRPLAWMEAFALARHEGLAEKAKHFADLANKARQQIKKQPSDAQRRRRLARELGLEEGEKLTLIEAEVPGEEVIQRCIALRSAGLNDDVILMVQAYIDEMPPELHVRAWYEAFYAAQAKGDTELAKQFVMAIADADPQSLTQAG